VWSEATVSTPAAAPLQIAALQGAAFGVRVQGDRLQDLAAHPADAAIVRSLIAHHRVVLLQGLQLDAPGLMALASQLGRVRPASQSHPSLPEPARQHLFVSARDAASVPAGPTPADAAHMWHADYSASTTVARLAMLYALNMPPGGSCNGFMDMARVHAALPPALQQEIASLQACHYAHPQGVDLHGPADTAHVPWAERVLGTAHPLVMYDAQRRPFLFLPAHSDSPVVGRNETQSRALLERLWSYVEAHGNAWEYTIADGELLVWDNRATMHRRGPWPRTEDRLLWFLTAD
jgi:taurine dioxygenase